MKKRLSIKIGIVHTFTILIFITVAVICYVFYQGSRQVILPLFLYSAETVAEKITDKTAAFIQKPEEYIKMTTAVVRDIDIVDNHEPIWRFFWKKLKKSPSISSFYIADAQGNFIQVRRDPELSTRILNRNISPAGDRWISRDKDYSILETENREPDYDPRIRPWYKKAEISGKLSWSEVYSFFSTKEAGITVSAPVYDKNNKIKAIVGVDITLTGLSEFITDQKKDKAGILCIINEKDEVISFSRDEFPESPFDIGINKRLPLVNETGYSWLTNAFNDHKSTGKLVTRTITDKIRYISFLSPIPETHGKKWHILRIIEEDYFMGWAKEILYRALFYAVLITFICMLIIYVASGFITKPISKLVEEADFIKKLSLDKVRGIKSPFKEIDQMNDAFLSMKSGLESFRRYVPADLVSQLVKSGVAAKLGGKKADLTIMFTDIVGFTSISEKMTAESLMLHLSEYLEHLTQIISEERGTVDKFIGDAIMAFWGAPIKIPDSSYRACLAAIRCKEKLEMLNKNWKSQGKPEMLTRFGINAGNTIVGNVGSSDRMNYSIIGDNVNLASRLEGLNKLYGTTIIISESVFNMVKEYFLCRPLDNVAVKGKTKGTKIYELIRIIDTSVKDEQFAFVYDFENGIKAYQEKSWEKALEIFTLLKTRQPDDTPTSFYIDRCRKLIDNPDIDITDWDGISRPNVK